MGTAALPTHPSPWQGQHTASRRRALQAALAAMLPQLPLTGRRRAGRPPATRPAMPLGRRPPSSTISRRKASVAGPAMPGAPAVPTPPSSAAPRQQQAPPAWRRRGATQMPAAMPAAATVATAPGLPVRQPAHHRHHHGSGLSRTSRRALQWRHLLGASALWACTPPPPPVLPLQPRTRCRWVGGPLRLRHGFAVLRDG